MKLKFVVKYASSHGLEGEPEVREINSLDELLSYVEYTVREQCIVGLNPSYRSESPYSDSRTRDIKWRILVYDDHLG